MFPVHDDDSVPLVRFGNYYMYPMMDGPLRLHVGQFLSLGSREEDTVEAREEETVEAREVVDTCTVDRRVEVESF